MISFTRIDLAGLGLETMGFNRQFVLRPLLDPNSEFPASVGNGLPSEFLFVLSPDADLCAGQSETLFSKYIGEYDEVMSMRVALLFTAGGRTWNRTWRQDKHQHREE